MKDLHLHLSGSTDPAILWELIKESGYKTKAKDFWHFKNSIMMSKDNVKDLNEYLNILHTIDRAQSYPSAVEESVYDAYKNAFLSGCTYLELRWNPTKRSQNNTIDLDKLIISARAGMERAKANFGIEGGMILCMGRDCTKEANEAVFMKAKQYQNKGIKGIDLAGPYDWKIWKDQVDWIHQFFHRANDLGMTTTMHVGEIDHPNVHFELSWAINTVNPERIGHGIQVVKHQDLISELAYKEIMLEVCISSNLATGAVKSHEEFKHIFQELDRWKIKYTICTDATFLLKTNIKREYELYESITGKKPPA